MKRSIAIRGETPMFVRWAIEYQCPLRDIFPERLPETTFRQLRGIREVSMARLEGRIHHGYCLHPQAKDVAPDEALGFPVVEVAQLFGGSQTIERHCYSCPANAGASPQSNLWAGCFGILSIDLRFSFDSMVRGQLPDSELAPSDLRNAFGGQIGSPNQGEVHRYDTRTIMEQFVGDDDLIDELNEWNPLKLPVWFALWREQPRSKLHLSLIERILDRTSDFLNRRERDQNQSASNYAAIDLVDLSRMLDAVRRCQSDRLLMHIELVPCGYSDGVVWKINSHCKNCKQAWPIRAQPCQICGTLGKYQNEIKLKVLGIRPYLKIASILGLEESRRLLES